MQEQTLIITNATNTTNSFLSLNAQVMRIVMPTESILFILLTILPTIMAVVLYRSPVIKAYNLWYLLFTGCASSVNYIRYAIFWGMEGQTEPVWEYLRSIVHIFNNTILLWFILFLLFIQFWRIVHIFEINRIQYQISEEQHQSLGEPTSEEKIKKLKKRLKLHQYFVSKTFFFLVFCFIGVVHILACILSILILVAFSTIYSYYFSLGFCIISGLTCGAVITITVILISSRKIKAPYYIWPVTIWQLFTLLIFIIYNFIILARVFITVDVYLLVFNLLTVPPSLLITFVGSMSVLLTPIAMHLYISCKGNEYEEIEENLTKVVEDKHLSKLFQTFCVLEWSSENVTFYMEMKKLRSLKVEAEKWAQIEKMVQLFFETNAPMPLNTTYEKLAKVRLAFGNKDRKEVEISLESIEADVNICMADTYQRFLSYKPYREHRKSISLVTTTQKQLGWTVSAEENVKL